MSSYDADSYLRSPLGWSHQAMQRLRREVHFSDANEPVAKGRRGRRRAVQFQHDVVTTLRRLDRRAMTGAVALDVDFTCCERNPPSIHRLAKYLLDVLGPAIDPKALGRRSVLYGDDRQVKLLHVSLGQAWDPAPNKPPQTPGTHVVARPIRDVAEDLRVADEIRALNDPWPTEEDAGPFYIPGDDFNDVPTSWPSREELSLAESLEQFERFDQFWRRYRAQESHLTATDAYLLSYLCACPNDIAGTRETAIGVTGSVTDHIASISEMYRPLLLTLPFGLPLPGFALVSGEWKTYGERARTALSSFLDRWPLFRPLLVPIKVTLMITPSIRGMDLDNIALTLLPVIHEVLRPHIDPLAVHRLGMSLPSEGPEHEKHNETLLRLRSLNQHSVTAYQVIELKRTSRSPKDGTINVLLGDGSRPQSSWEIAQDYLHRTLPNLRR